jgi:outer membrane receptor protein involved in Fe transport
MSYGAQYDFVMGNGLDSYVRLDGTYQHRYSSGATFGSSGYGANYFLRENPTREQLNLRAGVRLYNGLDINVFVLNVLNEDKLIAGFGDGRGACSATSQNCSVYTTYNPFVAQTFQTPRRIGLQVNYKF